ncbi:MAG: phospholipase C [Solirubrobacteraceae bacterium]
MMRLIGLGRKLVAGGALLAVTVMTATAVAAGAPRGHASGGVESATPIHHLVVIFDENVSFDHYFGTYPHAANPPGEPAFYVAPGTPTVNGLSDALLAHNPNSENPQRLDRSQALTCDQDHSYTAEQQAFDHGLMDKFVESTGVASCPSPYYGTPGLVMDYYDGNTVTALWNYAQRFAMSDNSYSTVFGPTAPGHLNLISGQTHGATTSAPTPAVANGTLISTGGEAAKYEDCSPPGTPTVEMSGQNVGDLLTAKGVSWGWFSEGFRPTSRLADGTAVCGSEHANIGGQLQTDYYSGGWVDPFQYYQSTANPHHLAPASIAEIGHAGQANHQYDLSDFWRALDAGRMPAVSYLKPPVYQNGHAQSSDPLDEQHFLVNTINRVESSPDWKSTAIIIAYDDSDGWYDHQMSPIINDSQSPQDALSGDGMCGARIPSGGYQDRCGYGPRQPLLVISPYSRVNAVDHHVSDQTSILRFVEDNWLGGERIGDGSFDTLAGSLGGLVDFSHPHPQPLYLNPITGERRR